MSKYILMPELCKWIEVEASTPEMAYKLQCSWYPGKRIAVMEKDTGRAWIFASTEFCKSKNETKDDLAPKYVYFFDCLDAFIDEKYLSAEDIAELLTGHREPMQEKEIIATAKDYEATLYRYELDGSGAPCNGAMIYDCMY